MRKQNMGATLHQFAPRRTPRQKRSQIVFDKIIATAKTLFKRDGYAYVSTSNIADKANISIGSLYQYFTNRESIALAVYEDACSKAALSIKRRTLEILSFSLEDSIPRHIEWVFDVFEKDRYALLQLINEVPELRRVSQPLSLNSLLYHTTQMFFDQHFTDISREIVARKSYVINNCVVGVISRYMDEKPDILNKSEIIAEITELVQMYASSLSRYRNPTTLRSS